MKTTIFEKVNQNNVASLRRELARAHMMITLLSLALLFGTVGIQSIIPLRYHVVLYIGWVLLVLVAVFSFLLAVRLSRQTAR